MFPQFTESKEAVVGENGVFSGGKPRKVVEWLMFKETSPFLFESFMRVYPMYGFTPEGLFGVSRDIYLAVPVESRESVISFLCDWILRRYVQDFRDRPVLWTSVMDLCQREPAAFAGRRREDVLQCKSRGDAEKLPELMFSPRTARPSTQQPPQPDLSPPPQSPSKQPSSESVNRKRLMQFQRWKSDVIAETLTMFGHERFREMPPHEMCGEKDRTVLDEQVAFFSTLSNLVAWSITQAVFPLSLLKKFVKIAHNFYKQHNYNFLGAIITGLNSGHVQSMKSVWKDLPQKSKELYEKYDALVSPIRNFAAYRAQLAEVPAGQPCYPYLAVLMRDLNHINEGNPTLLPNTDGLINYHKISLLGTFIEGWRVFQQNPYTLPVNQKVAMWIEELSGVPDMSRLVEEEEPAPATTGQNFLRKVSTQMQMLRNVIPAKLSRGSSSNNNNNANTSSGKLKTPDVPSSGGSASPSPSTSPRPEDDVSAPSSHPSSLPGTPPDTGSDQRKIRQFLFDRGLQKYEPVFDKHSIRMNMLKEMTDHDLKVMGVEDKTDRVKIVQSMRNISDAEMETSSGDKNDVDIESDGDEVSDDAAPTTMYVSGTYEGRTVTVRVTKACTVRDLEEVFGKGFNIPPKEVVIKLTDYEGDLIRLTKQVDLDYALLHADKKGTNQLFVIFRKQ